MKPANPLPQFERPPLNEVAIGIQFEPIKALRIAHLGGFWQSIRDRYPVLEDHGPIAHLVEQPVLAAPRPPEGESIIIDALALKPRCWFMEESKRELLQLQNDRFHRNWRQTEGGNEEYPRFKVLFDRFLKEWSTFLAYLEDQRIGRPAVDQCEVTYINHIPQGELWNQASDLHKVFTRLAPPPSAGFLPGPEITNWHANYLLPNESGRLYAHVRLAIRNKDRRPIVAFEMTARGAPKSQHADDVNRWYEMAHEWVVRGFADLTTSRMHEHWGRNDAS